MFPRVNITRLWGASPLEFCGGVAGPGARLLRSGSRTLLVGPFSCACEPVCTRSLQRFTRRPGSRVSIEPMAPPAIGWGASPLKIYDGARESVLSIYQFFHFHYFYSIGEALLNLPMGIDKAITNSSILGSSLSVGSTYSRRSFRCNLNSNAGKRPTWGIIMDSLSESFILSFLSPTTQNAQLSSVIIIDSKRFDFLIIFLSSSSSVNMSSIRFFTSPARVLVCIPSPIKRAHHQLKLMYQKTYLNQ